MKPINTSWEEEFVEKAAEMEHSRWARWQQHVFNQCKEATENGLVIPQFFVDKWGIQIDTPYSELSEKEKESYRKEVSEYLPLIRFLLSEQKKAMVEAAILKRRDFAKDEKFIFSHAKDVNHAWENGFNNGVDEIISLIQKGI